MTKLRQYGLSKSKIAAFEQCPKRLWLQVHKREDGIYDDNAQAMFGMGNEIGTLACELMPGGIEVLADPDLSAALLQTEQLMRGGFQGPIFEATVMHEGVLVRVDILQRQPDGRWFMAEVKSSTSVKDYHRGDLATQIWVMRGAGFELGNAAVRHVDNSFVLKVEGDYRSLLKDRDLMAELESIVADRGRVTAAARKTLGGEEPEIATGAQCHDPFDCEFSAYCNGDEPSQPDWPLEALPHWPKTRLAASGATDLMAVEINRMDSRDRHLVEAVQSGIPFHDRAGAIKMMSAWGWPRAWLDFETIGFAVPRWVGTRAYQQVPFQFSLHLEHENGTMSHEAFLATDGLDPRRTVADALIAMIPAGATIVAYNASFERRVIEQLARDFPDIADELNAHARRIVDLLPVARKCWYDRDQWGSWSIKAVLPTVSITSYDTLEVKDGGNAQLAYLEATAPETPPARKLAIENALHAYCKQDTWAMVEIARRLMGEAG